MKCDKCNEVKEIEQLRSKIGYRGCLCVDCANKALDLLEEFISGGGGEGGIRTHDHSPQATDIIKNA